MSLLLVLLAACAQLLLPTAEASYSLSAPKISSLQNTSSGIQVKWKAVSGAAKYAVYRKTTGGWVKKATVSGTSYTDQNVSGGTVYAYKIRCVNASGKPVSPNVDGKNKLMALKVPEISSVANTTGGIKIAFQTRKGAESYQIYRRVGSSGDFVRIGTSKTGSYLDQTAVTGTSYSYRVRAVNTTKAVKSAFSDSSSLIKRLVSPAVTASVKTAGVKLTWPKVTGASYYCVLRKTASGSWVKKAVVSGTSYLDETVLSGYSYRYKVRCVNKDGSRYLSANPSKATAVTFLRAPSLSALTDQETGIQVKWSKVANADSYIIYRKTGNGSWVKKATVSGTKNTYLDKTASVAGVYTYTVRAVNADGVKSGYGVNQLKITAKKAFVNKPQLILYTSSGNGTPVQMAAYMESVEYLDTVSASTSGDWIHVRYAGKKYYFWQPAGEAYLTRKKSTFSYTGSNAITEEMIALAMDMYKNWNIVYRHGASNGIPDSSGKYGYDCSGFASYVLNTVMQRRVPVYWVTSTIAQFYATDIIYNEGMTGAFSATDVDPGKLKPGDILFFKLSGDSDLEGSTSSKAIVTHCGLYLGNNEFIHCTHYDDFKREGLFIAPLTHNFSDRLIAVRRYTPSSAPKPANKKMTVTSCVNIRAEASSSSKILTTLSAGDSVTVLYAGSASWSNWVYVSCQDGTKGYLLKRFLK